MFYEIESIDASKIDLKEEEKSKKSKFKALVLTANFLNQNGRWYPSEVIEAATEKIQAAIEARKVCGSSAHETSGVHDISHKVTGLKFNKKTNELWMDGTILDTTKGKDLKTILKSGGSLGLSIAALGKTEKKKIEIGGEKVEVDVIQPGLEIQKIDFTTTPAFPDSRMDAGSMFESEDFSVGEEDLLTSEREDMKKSFRKIFDEKYDSGEIDPNETFKGWLEEAGLSNEQIDEEIRKDRESKGASKLIQFEEALDSGYVGNFSSWAKLEMEVEEETDELSKFDEAVESGFKGSKKDWLEAVKNED